MVLLTPRHTHTSSESTPSLTTEIDGSPRWYDIAPYARHPTDSLHPELQLRSVHSWVRPPNFPTVCQ